MRLRVGLLGILVGLVVMVFGVATAVASITGSTGDFVIISNPSGLDVSANGYQSNFVIRAFPEQQGVLIDQGLELDITTGNILHTGPETPVEINDVTVNSYLLHFDADNGIARGTVGTITFEEEIIGLITDSARLDVSDSLLGASGVTYPTAGDEELRGFDDDGRDKVYIRSGRRTLWVKFLVNALYSDQIRVITAGTAGGGGDTTPPVIHSVSVDPSEIGRPNHKMVSVNVSVDATDDSGVAPSCEITSISDDESNDPADSEKTGDLEADVRAERDGGGDGRTYTIDVICTDEAGNTAEGSVDVTVVHDQGNGKAKGRNK